MKIKIQILCGALALVALAKCTTGATKLMAPQKERKKAEIIEVYNRYCDEHFDIICDQMTAEIKQLKK